MKTQNNQGRSTRKVVVLPAAGYHGSHIIGNGNRNNSTPLGNGAYCRTTGRNLHD